MAVIPLKDDFSNAADFLESLFEPDVRSLAALKSAIQAKKFSGSFSAESDKILALWKAAWLAAQSAPHDVAASRHCPASDRNLLQYLGGFIAQNRLAMFLPELTFDGLTNGGLPIYELKGYQQSDFLNNAKWEEQVVEKFLHLLMAGAHFVVVHAARDLPEGVSVNPLWRDFKTDEELVPSERRDLPGNSHYTRVTNPWGEYYPKIERDAAPQSPPFILSFLVSPTVSPVEHAPEIYNTFFQLEGWEETQLKLHGRHMIDYDNHEKTLWNISTYGFCAYSEKRGTAIFLAPSSWKPEIASNTFMTPYVGAESRQHWLNTAVIHLPDSFWKVIARASCSPLPGQKQRCSDDFMLDAPAGAKQLRWSVQSAKGVSFDLWENVKFSLKQPLGADRQVWKDLQHNATTPLFPAGKKYYIANVRGCADPQDFFAVHVEAEATM